MSGEGWALEAVEREAMSRAHRQLASLGFQGMVCGLTVQQILWLRQDYLKRGGKIEDIPGGPGSYVEIKTPATKDGG